MNKLLVMHGSDDLLVSPRCAEEIYALAKEPKEIHLLPNAGHNCKNAKEKVVALAVSWLSKWLL